jgi:hypothetical protein
MIEARLVLAVQNRETARSLIKAIEPDNKVSHLKIIGSSKAGSLAFRLKFDGGIETFISTVDDMLRCLQAAMETLDTIEKREPE